MLEEEKSKTKKKETSIYDFNVVNADGQNVSLKIFKGKVLLIFNMGKNSKHVG